MKILKRIIYIALLIALGHSECFGQSKLSLSCGLDLHHNDWFNNVIEDDENRYNLGLGLSARFPLHRNAELEYGIQALVLPITYEVNQVGVIIVTSMKYRSLVHSLSYRYRIIPNIGLGFGLTHNYNFNLQFEATEEPTDKRTHFNLLGFTALLSFKYHDLSFDIRYTKYVDVTRHLYLRENQKVYSIALWFNYPLISLFEKNK